ncbi:MAG TPA: GNAT family protein [Streptosporangiaceae bacterium]
MRSTAAACAAAVCAGSASSPVIRAIAQVLSSRPSLARARSWAASSRCATLGIALGREYIGHGYGTDAMRVIVGYGFREMGLHSIQLSVAAFNPAGIRAYEKAGFVEEGRHRESVLHDGR